MIEADRLRKRYGEVVALDGVSFRAENGRITALLGPNGAGKTTALRILSGLVRPDGGGVRIDGIDVATRPLAARARLGMLPDARGLYARLTARENIRYYAELQGVPRENRERRIDALLSLLDLRALAERRAGGFSQGERMKVAIARALVHDPENVVLDEPTNGLDVMSIRALRRFTRRLAAEGRSRPLGVDTRATRADNLALAVLPELRNREVSMPHARCPSCPEYFTMLTAKVNDPLVYEVLPQGTRVDPAVAPGTRALFEQIAAGVVRLVPAAEPLGRLALATGTSSPILRAVTLDATASVSKMLVSSAIDEPINEELRTPKAGSPVLRDDKGIVLSATLRRVFVLGGTVDGTPAAAAEPSAWVLDADTNDWTEYALEPAERPGTVLGATYRMDDRAIYLVDIIEDVVRLRRWRPTEAVVTLATLPGGWGSFPRNWLVAGQLGDLVFVGSTAGAVGPQQSVLVRFTVSTGGRPVLAGALEQPSAVLAAPLVGRAVTLIVPDSSGGRLEVVEQGALTVPPAGAAPVIHGWPEQPLAALASVALMAKAEVSGDVAIRDVAVGPVLNDSAELFVGPLATVGGSVTANTIRLGAKAAVTGGAFFNELWAHPKATVLGAQHSPLSLPIALRLPVEPTWPAGGSNVAACAGQRLELEAGSYGKVSLAGGTKKAPTVLSLSGGRYGFKSLTMGPMTRLQCTTPCEVRITGRLEAGAMSFIGPTTSFIGPSAVRLTIEGSNGGDGGPNALPHAAGIGPHAVVQARIHVPAGTLALQADSAATGRLVARHVRLGPAATLSADAGDE